MYSLYGDVLSPTNNMLAGLNALVFDIQDAGARFYTYITTMGYAMEACAKREFLSMFSTGQIHQRFTGSGTCPGTAT